jgi:hypothetical protein
MPSAITATTAPTSATSPAGTRISASTPVVVDGTSIDTLSVSISNRLSPGLTASPADLNHFVIFAVRHGLAELRHQDIHFRLT